MVLDELEKRLPPGLDVRLFLGIVEHFFNEARSERVAQRPMVDTLERIVAE